MGADQHFPRRAVPRCAAGLALLALIACAEELPGYPPVSDQLHYPISLAVAGEHLLIVSSNFDQRYNAGSLTALSLAALGALAPETGAPAVTRELPATGRSQLKISSFGGQMAAVPRADGTEVYVATRRGNRVTRARFADGLLDCTNGDVATRTRATDCTPARTADTIADGELLAEDPFAVAYVPGVTARGVVVVGALRTLSRTENGIAVPVGVLSLVLPEAFDVNLAAEQADGDIIRPMRNVGLVGIAGALSIAPIPGTTEVLVAAADADAITSFGDLARVAHVNVRSSTAGLGIARIADVNVGRSAGADATRGVAVSADGQRGYVSLRLRQDSGTAILFNSAIGVLSVADARTLSVLEVGEELGTPTILERPGMRPSRLVYLPDLRTDRIFVVDASTDDPVLVHVIEPTVTPGATQRLIAGPAQILILPEASRALVGGRTLAFVASFANSTLGVLDLSDPDPRRHRVVARIGRALADDGVDEVE